MELSERVYNAIANEGPRTNNARALADEIVELEEKLNSPTCHRGHSDYPLTLWDCPTCVQIEKKKLEAEIQRLRVRVLGDGITRLEALEKNANERSVAPTSQETEMFEKINIELLKSNLSGIAMVDSSGQIALDYIVQLEAKLAETKKIGEELIDERDDIIASFEAENALLHKNVNLAVELGQKYARERTKLQQLKVEIAALQQQVERLRKYATHEFRCPVLNTWPQDCTCGLEALETGDEDEQSQPFTGSIISAFIWPFALTLEEIAIWATVSDRMRKHLASNEVVQLEADNAALQERYSEQCARTVELNAKNLALRECILAMENDQACLSEDVSVTEHVAALQRQVKHLMRQVDNLREYIIEQVEAEHVPKEFGGELE